MDNNIKFHFLSLLKHYCTLICLELEYSCILWYPYTTDTIVSRLKVFRRGSYIFAAHRLHISCSFHDYALFLRSLDLLTLADCLPIFFPVKLICTHIPFLILGFLYAPFIISSFTTLLTYNLII